MKIGDMVQGRISRTEETISELALKNSAAKVLPVGTVLISIFATIGRTAVLEIEAATNQAIAGLRIKEPEQLDASYLRIFLDYFARQLEQRARGVAQVNINSGILRTIPVPLPTLAQQRRIAEVLDRAEALRAKRREALTHLDGLTHAIFISMFGEVNATGWPTVYVNDIADAQSGSIRTGPFGSQLLHDEFVSEGIAVLGIDNAVTNEFRWAQPRFITEAKYRQLTRYTVRPGDVLITIMGTCGRCVIVPDDVPTAINTKHLCCITLDQERCLPTFLRAYFLLHPIARQYLERTAKGAIMSGLNMGIIKGMPVLLPPLDFQREFARRVEAIERMKATQRASLAELDALFASLQHRAFRGEL